MGPQKASWRRELTFCKKLRARPSDKPSKNIKNHQESSLFEFAVEIRPLRDPKAAPRRVPVSAALYRECANGRPEGPPSSQHKGASFVFVFFRAQKNVVFRIRDTRLAQNPRPGAIRGAPYSRIETAPRVPFGTPKMDGQYHFYVWQKAPRPTICYFRLCVCAGGTAS